MSIVILIREVPGAFLSEDEDDNTAASISKQHTPPSPDAKRSSDSSQWASASIPQSRHSPSLSKCSGRPDDTTHGRQLVYRQVSLLGIGTGYQDPDPFAGQRSLSGFGGEDEELSIQELLKSLDEEEDLPPIEALIREWPVEEEEAHLEDAFRAVLESMKTNDDDDGRSAAEILDSLLRGESTVEQVYGRRKEA